MNPVNNYQNALQNYIQNPSLQNFAGLELVPEAVRQAEFDNLANQQNLIDLSNKALVILNQKIGSEPRLVIKKKYEYQRDLIQGQVNAANKANNAAQLVLFSKPTSRQKDAAIRPATVQNPITKPAAQQAAPVVQPAAKPANTLSVYRGNSPFNSFYFERRSNKLYFCAVFTPNDMKARDLLIKGKGIKINAKKSVMDNGVYYTKDKDRQLSLLKIAFKNKAISGEQMDDAKKLIKGK